MRETGAIKLETPSYGKQLARIILHESQAAWNEIYRLESSGDQRTATERQHQWHDEIFRICETGLLQMQAVIDHQQSLIIENLRRTITRPPVEVPVRRRLFAITGWRYKWIWELERGPFRSGRLILRRELRRWL